MGIGGKNGRGGFGILGQPGRRTSPPRRRAGLTAPIQPPPAGPGKDIGPRSRGAWRPGFVSITLEERVQGMPGAFCTGDLVCKIVKRTHTRSNRYRRSNPAFPAQWPYGLCRALPRRRIPVCHRHLRIKVRRTRSGRLASASLAPATGVGTTRFCRTLKRRSSCAPRDRSRVWLALRPRWRASALASTTSRPAFVTTRDPPLLSERDDPMSR